MSTKERFFVLVLIVAATLPFVSWAMSALGMPCRSLLDGEGLRWLFRHWDDCLHSRLVAFALGFLMMQGVIGKYLLPLGETFRKARFRRFAAVYAIIFLSVLAAAVQPFSPLLSITGGIAGSPLLDGLLFLCWLSFMIFCLCYGHSRREPWWETLTRGIRSQAIFIPIAIVLSFCWHCIAYVIS